MKQALKHKIGLLCACAATLSYMSITPVLSDVSTAFPNTDTIWIQMLVTIPSLFLMPFSLLAGQLAGKLGNRRLALLGVAQRANSETADWRCSVWRWSCWAA